MYSTNEFICLIHLFQQFKLVIYIPPILHPSITGLFNEVVKLNKKMARHISSYLNFDNKNKTIIKKKNKCNQKCINSSKHSLF